MPSLLSLLPILAALAMGFLPLARPIAAAETVMPVDVALGAAPHIGAVDLIVVYKGERRMFLLRDGQVLREFTVALGDSPRGHKFREGDERTPEGSYEIDYRLRDSSFYRALRVSYPNDQDRRTANLMGVSPGGQIMIHGLPNGRSADDVGHPVVDWTDGCIAVTNAEMDVIWEAVSLGTRILIFP